MTALRVTALVREVLITRPRPALRVTALVREVLRSQAIFDTVNAVPGHLGFAGDPADVLYGHVLTANAGELAFTGFAASVVEVTNLRVPGAGHLAIAGYDASILTGSGVTPPTGHLVFTGNRAALNVFTAASQLVTLVLGEIVPEARGSQLSELVLGEISPPANASELAALVLGEIVPWARASQVVALVLADGEPCVSRMCECWKITRRDGTVFAYTSHDRDVLFQGRTWKTCASLNPTASEQSSSIGSIGNVDLQGLIVADEITEEDIYGGLFDDAFVEVWRASWDADVPEVPVRLAAGWIGNTEHDQTSFKMEVLGPGVRLAQQPLVQPYSPPCRWVFGDASTCKFDREALAISGTVLAAPNRGNITTDVEDPGGVAIWNNGLLRWLYGRNAGVECEVKSVDFETGEIVLWAPPHFLPEAGDDFTLLPGCTKQPDQCKAYDNYINYGGFPDVPGTDAISATPDAKY